MNSLHPLPTTTPPDRLTTLPPEILLMVSGHLSPRFCTRSIPHESKLISHPALLAFSRTCKCMHAILTPELVKAIIAVTEDPLWFAIKRAHPGLVAKLLEEKWVEATEERLVYWVVQGGKRLLFYTRRHMEWEERERESEGEGRDGEEGENEERVKEVREHEDGKREEARELVVEMLLKLGAGKRLGREWNGMVRDRWPGKWGMDYSMLRGARRLLLTWRVKP